jgi:hypothetical protein
MVSAGALLAGSARAATMDDESAAMQGDEAASTPDYGSAAAGSGDTARTVLVTVTGNDEHGRVPATPGEPVRLMFNRTSGPENGTITLPDQGVVAPLPLGATVTLTVRSARDGIDYDVKSQSAASRAAQDDAAEVAAGNTGGRG